MPAARQPQFTWSDAWLLLAIAMASHRAGAPLTQIIAAGDSIEHAIFSGPELRRGIAKLVEAGYVRDAGGTFHLAGRARKLWAVQGASRQRVATLMKTFTEFLEAAQYPAGDPREEDPVWQYPGLTDDVVARAFREYCQRAEAAGRRRKKTSPAKKR